MDMQYDKDGAASLLHDVSMERTQTTNSDSDMNQLSIFETSSLRIIRTELPSSHRLVRTSVEKVNGLEDIVFRIQGIIMNKLLPPLISNRVSKRGNKGSYKLAQSARQAVTLTGLGSDLFDKAVTNCAKIHDLFRECLPEGKLLPWRTDTSDGHIVLHMHSRYFTHKRYANLHDVQEFEPGVDVDGQLKELQGFNFVHTSDNVVQYLAMKKENDESNPYVKIDPTMFHIGDIVEVAVSFVCFPLRDGYYRMFVALRALILLDNRHREEGRAKRISSIIDRRHVPLTLKRKLVYTREDDRKSENMVL